MTQNNTAEILRRTAKEALDRCHLAHRRLCGELVDWVVDGGSRPSGEIEPREEGVLYGALTEGLTAAYGDSLRSGVDPQILARRDQVAPI